MTNEYDELRAIADTIEANGGWRIAAVKVRAAALELERLRKLLDCKTFVTQPLLDEWIAKWGGYVNPAYVALDELRQIAAGNVHEPLPCPSVHDHMWAEDGHCMRCYAQKSCEHDLQKKDHTMVLTHDLRTGHEYDSVAKCKVCGEQFIHPLHSSQRT
jgi:hypothetical protein